MGNDNNVCSKVNKKGILYIFQFQLNFMIRCPSYGDKHIYIYYHVIVSLMNFVSLMNVRMSTHLSHNRVFPTSSVLNLILFN